MILSAKVEIFSVFAKKNTEKFVYTTTMYYFCNRIYITKLPMGSFYKAEMKLNK